MNMRLFDDVSHLYDMDDALLEQTLRSYDQVIPIKYFTTSLILYDRLVKINGLDYVSDENMMSDERRCTSICCEVKWHHQWLYRCS